MVNDIVDLALSEDIGSGDLSASLIPEDLYARAAIIAKESGIMVGFDLVSATFRRLDPQVEIKWCTIEGNKVLAGKKIAEIRGKARALLSAERTALNFLQTLSGTATFTHEVNKLLKHTSIKLLDTRKTLPGLRVAQKRAVKLGGAENHREGLFDMVLLKENHITILGSIAEAVKRSKILFPGVKIEVEVRNVSEFLQAKATPVDIVMLDNFSLAEIKEVILLNRGEKILEVSGGINLQSLPDYTNLAVDYISMGDLTKQVKPIDLSMLFNYEI